MKRENEKGSYVYLILAASKDSKILMNGQISSGKMLGNTGDRSDLMRGDAGIERVNINLSFFSVNSFKLQGPFLSISYSSLSVFIVL